MRNRRLIGPGKPRLSLMLLAVVSLLMGCAGPTKARMKMPAPQGISVADGTRLAAQAMQDTGHWPKSQNEAAGQVSGEKTHKVSFGWETATTYLEVTVVKTPDGGLETDAKCSVSQNMAYWNEGGKCVDEFHEAFRKRLAAWQPPVRTQPPPEYRTPPPEYRTPAPERMPVQQPPQRGPAGKEYNL